jgi:hypothetical protein
MAGIRELIMTPSNLHTFLPRRFLSVFYTAEDVTYEFSTDCTLLREYYEVRQAVYRRRFRTEQFSGEEDEHDRRSRILIAEREKTCVGGCRINVRDPDDDFILPMEDVGFSLREIFWKERYCDLRHAEVSRFAIAGDKYEKTIMYRMLSIVFDVLLELEVSWLFVKSTLPMARNWRKGANLLGFGDNMIHTDIDIPECPLHPGIKWYIGRVNLADRFLPKRIDV